jgi:hypothetical protein
MAARFRSQAAHPRLAAMAMRRYAALLRSVTTNAKMPDLRRASEAAGFTGGRTLSTSGNVVFDARPTGDAALHRKAEAAMAAALGRAFLTSCARSMRCARSWTPTPAPRSSRRPRRSASSRSCAIHRAASWRFRSRSTARASRACAQRGAHRVRPSGRGPVFMTLIEKMLGDALTTRTWDTVKKVIAPAGPRR